jgi:hypothetical protein
LTRASAVAVGKGQDLFYFLFLFIKFKIILIKVKDTKKGGRFENLASKRLFGSSLKPALYSPQMQHHKLPKLDLLI